MRNFADTEVLLPAVDMSGIVESPVEDSNLCCIVVAHSWDIQKEEREESSMGQTVVASKDRRADGGPCL